LLRYFSLIFIVLLLSGMSYDEQLKDPMLEKRALVLERDIRCPSCAGQTIDGSNSQIATAMRHFIRERLAQGVPEAVIKQQLVNMYGDSILQTPPTNSYTYLLWGLPLGLVILTGFGWLYYRFKA
jgi:cytochrome c-type biogenesis protein CcmH/NrfF